MPYILNHNVLCNKYYIVCLKITTVYYFDIFLLLLYEICFIYLLTNFGPVVANFQILCE